MSSEFSGNDDFEKVEPDNYGAFQDESVTSTSMQGDMAEEDRYPSNEQDLLGDFSVGGMMAGSANSAANPPPAPTQPLINFENPMDPESTVPESAPESADIITDTKPTKPSAPPAEGLMGLPGMETMGCWMKNVDPRDEDFATSDPSVADMDEQQNTANTATDKAAAGATAPEAVTSGQPSGQSSGQPSQEVSEDQESLEVKGISETVIESESSGEYSEEFSSSGDESESINSDMESSEEEFGTKVNSGEKLDSSKKMEDVTTEECTVDSVYSDNLSTDNDISENMEMEMSENTGSFDNAVEMDTHVNQGMALEKVSHVESVPQELVTEIEDDNLKQDSLDLNIEDSGLENTESLSEGFIGETSSSNTEYDDTTAEKEGIVSADALLEQIESLTEDSFYEDDNVIGDVGEVNVNLNASEKERLDSSADEIVTEELECLQHTLDDLTDKGPVEKDTEYSSVGMSEDEMNKILEKLTSDGEECIDSVEKDEYLDNIDSPSFEDEQIVPSQSNDNSSDESVGSDESDGESSIDSDESGDEPVVGTWNPSPLHSLDLDDVTEVDMEEQMLDQNIQAAILSGYKYVEESNEEKLAFLEKEEKGVNEGEKEYRDTCRVQFSTPTNTIFYDPESPIIERVSMEVTDDLNDFDDQAKDIEKTKETKVVNEESDKLETDKDISTFSLYKSVRRKESTERDEEIEGAMELIQDTGLDELRSLASQLRHDDRDIKLESLQNITSTKQFADEPTRLPDDADTEVVLRRKNNKNVSEEYDRNEIDSMIIHDIEEPKLAQSNNPSIEAEPEGATGLNNRGSMIIYEEENTLLTEAVDSLNEMIPDSPESEQSMKGLEGSVEETDAAEIEQSLQHDREIIEEMIENHAISTQESACESCVKKYEDQQIEHYAAEVAAQIIDDINYESINTENNKVDEPIDIGDVDEQNNNIDEVRENLTETSESNESFDETCFEKSMETTVIETGGFEVNNDKYENDIDLTAYNNIQVADDVLEKNSESNVSENALEDGPKTLEQAIEKTVKDGDKLQAKPVPKESGQLKEAVTCTVAQEEVVNVPAEKHEPSKAVVASFEPEKMAYTAIRTDRARSSFSEKVTTMLLDVTSEVLEIIYWRDVKKTGVVFGSMMFVLLSLSLCSLLSVLAYLSLAVLAVTFSFRVYKSVMQAVQKTNEGHPFKKLMDLDIELRAEVVEDAAQKIADNVNNCSRELRRLYLVGDYVDSLKFGLLLWLMTYVGSWFNGMTLVILVVVSIFTLPKVYETYQGPIDQNVNLVRAQLNNIMAQVSAKIPFPKKKAKTQ